ncbi:MAG: hypothetical protein A2W00_01670 [Candidatus Eisenbacteria bacterium RBG_16_71_46]|nr:MAG: hypothetical protein A2W00_01670 [Candidatus Eisenbacteria bacterium RBG_16_71_46]
MPMRSPHCPGAASRARALGAAAWLTLAAGCASPPSAPTVVDWVIARPRPACDPGAPPEAMRWAIERLLTRGLVDEDSSGSIVPAAAQRYEVSDDGRVYTFHLAPALVFADSSPCVSADFRRALEAGLERTDHATQAWLLGSVIGVDRVRPGRVPDLGIETPDDRTLVLRLSRPDSLLLRKLALPGVSAPWSQRSGVADWDGMRGLGPYRVVSADGERMTLARFAGCSWGRFGGSDTLRLRFATNEARVRALLRAGRADLLWPTPPGMIGEALPGRYRWERRVADPLRFLLLVMRADVPPTSRPAARQVLSHGLNRADILRALGPGGRDLGAWISGAPAFAFPRLDTRAVNVWMSRGRFGRSFHVAMAYDADGMGEAVARELQGEWSRFSLSVELRPLRGEALAKEMLRGRAQLLLVESQALFDHVTAELAALVTPSRGPALGAFRTGWRTRAFDPWLAPSAAARSPETRLAQGRLEEERVALPLARLPWSWVARQGGPVAGFHPHYGPDLAPRVTARPSSR